VNAYGETFSERREHLRAPLLVAIGAKSLKKKVSCKVPGVARMVQISRPRSFGDGAVDIMRMATRRNVLISQKPMADDGPNNRPSRLHQTMFGSIFGETR
jgi:hypothetical protein